MASRRTRAPLLLAFLVAVYAGLVLHADGAKVLAALAGLAPGRVAAVLAVVFVAFLLRAARFQLYLRALGVEVPGAHATRIFMAGMSMGVTPGKLGEVLKSFLLRDEAGVPVRRTAGVVVLERVTDVLALLLLLGLFPAPRGPGWVEGLAFAGSAALLLPLVAPRPVLRVLRAPGWPGPAGPREVVAEALEAARPLAGARVLGGSIALALGSWALEALALAWLAGAAGAALPLGEAARIHAFATLAGAVSMLPGGVGAAEGSMTLLLRARGLAGPVAAAVTLSLRLCTLWFGVLVGAAALAVGRRDLGATLRALEREEEG